MAEIGPRACKGEFGIPHTHNQVCIFTCGDDVEYAGFELRAGGIRSRTHHCAVIHLRNWLISERRSEGSCLISRLRYVDGFGRVVETPLEVLGRRVGLHLAHHVGVLVACHSVDALLLGLANGLVCGWAYTQDA